ncbi:hypothetical protein FHP29_10090 [Nocardioides albidus]|uniref:Uncharacterized protein n=1 Tax=Nocardioides albidus TaxID=1517589 RepID=A0A5C4VZ27_9ACTN|nr:hypothetical protein [Nocardioides albidus]TNM40399.1 hypothetical protein FHP29_10090 [Nocardioides albidus]
MLGSRTIAWTAVVAALVFVAAGVALVALRDGGELEAGFVAEGTSGKTMTHEVEVQLPIGTVRLASGEPLEEIADRRVGRHGDGTVRAAGGATIVPVAWSFRPTLSYNDVLGYPTTFSLAVTAGGERTDLGEPDVDLHEATDSGLFPEASLIAVVAGDGDDLGFEVTYEGEAQSVAMATGKVEAGRAAALYPDGPQTYGTDGDCDARSAATSPDEIRYVSPDAGALYCRVDPIMRTPYLPDLGWASDGHVWHVVEVTVTAPRKVTWLPTGARYRVERDPVTVSLAGSEPVRGPRSNDDRETRKGTWIFDSPIDPAVSTLHLSAPMRAVRPSTTADGPASVDLGVDQTFELKQ